MVKVKSKQLPGKILQHKILQHKVYIKFNCYLLVEMVFTFDIVLYCAQ